MSTATRWIPVEALADYFTVPLAQLRAELQQRHLLGEVGGALHCTEGQAYLWAQRSYGADEANEMLADFKAFSFSFPESEVTLVEEVTATDGDYPYLI
ncbi:hypothetical protein J4H92_14140 [Leucobacter weissii]|uniref:Uncharacterized protein n=1 Tax=Leucobacter weissii TaxID=1983706 RepID=A0A939MR67_9MICO|nr:hypothetical protein [Leucobacter weissii]MBO1903081.1 hypothetical protein [Leucobacter weissii]